MANENMTERVQDYKKKILNKNFWLFPVPWQFNIDNDMSRAIPTDYYGGAFESAKWSTREDFQNAFQNIALIEAIDRGVLKGLGEYQAFSLLAHGYNSNAILGKVFNSEFKQAVFSAKSTYFPTVDTPYIDAWAEIAANEAPLSVNEFITVLSAERKIKYPNTLNVESNPGVVENLGLRAPMLEDMQSLETQPDVLQFNEDHDNFNSIMKNLSNKSGIEFVENKNLQYGQVYWRKKRFFGALDKIKKFVSPSKTGLKVGGWPKQFKLEYPQEVTHTQQLYSVIKCMCGYPVSLVSNIVDKAIVKNQFAPNLPSLENFAGNREWLYNAAGCLVASDVCLMIGLPRATAKMMSDTFRYEAMLELESMSEDAKMDKNYMPILAQLHAICMNEMCRRFDPNMREYAENRDISIAELAQKFGGNTNIFGVLYASNVQTNPELQLNQDSNSEKIAHILEQVLNQGLRQNDTYLQDDFDSVMQNFAKAAAESFGNDMSEEMARSIYERKTSKFKRNSKKPAINEQNANDQTTQPKPANSGNQTTLDDFMNAKKISNNNTIQSKENKNVTDMESKRQLLQKYGLRNTWGNFGRNNKSIANIKEKQENFANTENQNVASQNVANPVAIEPKIEIQDKKEIEEAGVIIRAKVKAQKKAEPVLKAPVLAKLSRNAEVLEYTAKKTEAEQYCRGFLYELVMEYSQDKMQISNESTKKLANDVECVDQQNLKNMATDNIDRASIGAVSGVMMYAKIKGNSKNSEFNRQNFPAETEAVRRIDNFTGVIMKYTDDFIKQNREQLKGIKITKNNVNKMLIAVANQKIKDEELQGNFSRQMKIEMGGEILKEVFKEAVYGILDDVEINKNEDFESQQLRNGALGELETKVSSSDDSRRFPMVISESVQERQ